MRPRITILIFGLLSFFGCEQKSNFSEVELELLNKLNFKSEIMSEVKNLTKNEFKQLPDIYPETGEVLVNKFYKGIYTETTEEKAISFVKSTKLNLGVMGI